MQIAALKIISAAKTNLIDFLIEISRIDQLGLRVQCGERELLRQRRYSNLTETSFETPTSSIVTP